MQTAVIIFLLVAVIVLFIVLLKLRSDLDTWRDRAVERSMMLDSAITDKRIIIKEKAKIEAERDRLSAENNELKAALVAAMTAPPAESSEPVEEVNSLLPPQDIPTNTFRCEPYQVYDEDTEAYKSAFAVNSEQRILQEDCFTDIETGIRYWFDTSDGSSWFCAALAGAYGIEIGHCYTFTLANGTVLPVILSDFKHPIDDPRPDDYGDEDTNYDGENCLSVIEFVVDLGAMPPATRGAGTMSKLEKFGGLYGHGGNIVDVKDVGRRWSP